MPAPVPGRYGCEMDVAAHLRAVWRSVDLQALDATVAVVLFGFMAFELALPPDAGVSPSNLLAYLMSAVITLPYAVHRRYPMAALAVSTWGVVVYALGHFNAFPGWALFVLLFGISLHTDRRRSAIALAAVVVAMSVALTLQPVQVVTTATWITTMLAVIVAWLSGENLRARRSQVKLFAAPEAMQLSPEGLVHLRRSAGERDPPLRRRAAA